ncbi:MAG: DUF3352 domain-containing protein, partial [Solirubrobacterales bacterium]|nr:DUF3352 domain-containing protein [Solirubrobacterales bacterium]
MSTKARPSTTLLVRLGGAIALLAAIVIAIIAAIGPGEPPPPTAAATVIPADALTYVNFSIDSGRPAVKRAGKLASKLPTYSALSAAVQSRLGGIAAANGSINFSRDIRPWLGGEAAIALLNTPSSTAGSLILLDVRDRGRAESFLNQAGAQAAGSYKGTQLRSYASGTELAFVRNFLVLGQDTSVKAAIDVAAGKTASLANSSGYQHAAAGEPDDRVLDAYVSAAGVRRVLAPQGGVLGALGALLYQPAMTAVTFSLSPTASGARVHVHTALDANLARLGGSARQPFTPTLVSSIPSHSMLMLEVSGLNRIAPQVLNAGAAGGVAGRLGPLLSRLGKALASEGVNVQDVISLFSGETAIAITPAVAVGSGTSAAAHPSLTIVAHTRNEDKTRTELAALEQPLQQLFPPSGKGPGKAPVFNDHQVAGATVHQLSLAPGLEFDYTVAGGQVIISTSLGAAAAVVTHARSLADDPSYSRALPPHPSQVTSLLFLDFSQLLNLAEQTGLQRSATYQS